MTDITQMVIDTNGFTPLEDGDTIDLLKVTKARSVVVLVAGGVTVSATPINRNNTGYKVYVGELQASAKVGEEGFYQPSGNVQLDLPELIDNSFALFTSEYGESTLTGIVTDGEKVSTDYY